MSAPKLPVVESVKGDTGGISPARPSKQALLPKIGVFNNIILNMEKVFRHMHSQNPNKHVSSRFESHEKEFLIQCIAEASTKKKKVNETKKI